MNKIWFHIYLKSNIILEVLYKYFVYLLHFRLFEYIFIFKSNSFSLIDYKHISIFYKTILK